MATENKQINHPVATGAALDAGHHQGLFGYDTTTGKCRFQFGPLLASTKQLANVGDAPTAHKASHENGGSDALVGQSIAGLRTSDSPNFATNVVSGVTRISAGGAATLTGLTSSGGGAFTGAKTSFATGVAGYAGMNIGGTGVAPTIPADGDYWRLGDGVQVRLGANTRTFMLSETTQTISGAKTFSALCQFSLGINLNGSTRPAWNTDMLATMIGHTSFLYSYSTAGSAGSPTIGRNFYVDSTGTTRALQTATGTSYPAYMQIDIDGALVFGTSVSNPTAGASISDMSVKFKVSKNGGVGFFGQAAPTTCPTVNAACTDLATCIALTNQLRTHLIACGLVQ